MDNLHNVIRELAEVYEAGGMKTTRFSITMTEKDNSRLEALSDKLQMSKQDLINKLLVAALTDLEDTLAGTERSGKTRKIIDWLGEDEGAGK
ncbi:hypothetical protein P4H42_03790 [Paenibacillus macerans]|uniref:hypothetical protein n=1 Tax=Paenibacillus macerans TaxID=44252 RepID=UPI002DBA73CF|nr:hypothetical protein [Paenibacillus macerans]MEC0328745.1 hypothetical protein [Paenibacillus macerans]